MEKVRAHVIVTGQVQGVYFRAHTREQALSLEVAGWVRNRPDGTVEGVFEGEKENVGKLIEWCREGPPRAGVSGVHVNWEEYRGDFSSFGITF